MARHPAWFTYGGWVASNPVFPPLHRSSPAAPAAPSTETDTRTGSWNYAVFIVDGCAYGAGTSLVAADSVLPNLVKALGGSDWLVALSPTTLALGYVVTPFLFARRFERARLYRRTVFWGSLPQRLPPLLAALALFFGWQRWPSVALWTIFLCPFVQGALAGLIATAFLELFAKVIPVDRRASNTALRAVIGTGIGMLSGTVIVRVIAAWPGPPGYAVLFLLQFAFFLMSWLSLGLVRERPVPPAETENSGRTSWRLRDIIAVVRAHRMFRQFMVVKMLGTGCGLVVPFLALHFRHQIGLSESFLGRFVQAETIGAIVGSVVAGYLGDRIGNKLPLCCSRIASVILCALIFTVHNAGGTLVCFGVLGLASAFDAVATNVFLLEVCPRACRPTLIAVQFFVVFVANVAAGLCAKVLYQSGAGLHANAIAAGVLAVASCAVLLAIPEPRGLLPDILHLRTDRESK